MSLSLVLLGTSASRPTVERNVSSIALSREGETMLFDCGEGTQRQMMRYGVAFALRDIFFTHFHADHVIGVIGLMRTMALQGRTDELRLWGPKGGSRHLKRAEQFGVDRLTFPVQIEELDGGQAVKRSGYSVVPFPSSTDRGRPSAMRSSRTIARAASILTAPGKSASRRGRCGGRSIAASR